MSRTFADRREAGRLLAEAVGPRLDEGGPAIVLALPRGGVPVAFEVASALGLPLDVWLVRKVGVPGQEELAMGAIGDDGSRVIDRALMRAMGIDEATFETVAAREQEELRRRTALYRGDRPPAEVRGRTVVLIDDGLASGASMRAAVEDVRRRGGERVIVAVPVAPPSACRELAMLVEGVVCLHTPEPFGGVGRWYDDFTQTTDDEVRWLLAAARGDRLV